MKKVACEVYSRVCGYYRPVSNFNPGKQAEFAERKPFELDDKKYRFQVFTLPNCHKCEETKSKLQGIAVQYHDAGTQGGRDALNIMLKKHRDEIQRTEDGSLPLPLVFAIDPMTGESVYLEDVE